MAKNPTVEFTATMKSKTYKGKKQESFVGSFLNENGEKILVSFNTKKYTSKKNGKTFVYCRATNLGHEGEYKKRNQMG